MDFTEYQNKSRSTAIYPNIGDNVIYPVLGLCGEAGEVAEKLKKVIRDNSGIFTEETHNLLKKELGDVLWYLAAIASEMGWDLSDVAQENLAKLAQRKAKDMLKGSGDTREVGPEAESSSPNIYRFNTAITNIEG